MGGTTAFNLRQDREFLRRVIAVPVTDFSERAPAANTQTVALIDHAVTHAGRLNVRQCFGGHGHAALARIARATRERVCRPSTPQM